MFPKTQKHLFVVAAMLSFMVISCNDVNDNSGSNEEKDAKTTCDCKTDSQCSDKCDDSQKDQDNTNKQDGSDEQDHTSDSGTNNPSKCNCETKANCSAQEITKCEEEAAKPKCNCETKANCSAQEITKCEEEAAKPKCDCDTNLDACNTEEKASCAAGCKTGEIMVNTCNNGCETLNKCLIRIKSAYDFNKIEEGKDYYLMSDIDLGSDSEAPKLKGILVGNGKKITYKKTNAKAAHLFASIENSKIYDLKLDADINTKATAGDNGILAATVTNSIIGNLDANIKASIAANGADNNAEFNIGFIGTLSNNNDVAISNSKIGGNFEVTANKAKTLNVGGLAGNIASTGTEYSKINDIRSELKLKVTTTDVQNAYIGGIGGQVQDLIENLYVSGDVEFVDNGNTTPNEDIKNIYYVAGVASNIVSLDNKLKNISSLNFKGKMIYTENTANQFVDLYIGGITADTHRLIEYRNAYAKNEFVMTIHPGSTNNIYIGGITAYVTGIPRLLGMHAENKLAFRNKLNDETSQFTNTKITFGGIYGAYDNTVKDDFLYEPSVTDNLFKQTFCLRNVAAENLYDFSGLINDNDSTQYSLKLLIPSDNLDINGVAGPRVDAPIVGSNIAYAFTYMGTYDTDPKYDDRITKTILNVSALGGSTHQGHCYYQEGAKMTSCNCNSGTTYNASTDINGFLEGLNTDNASYTWASSSSMVNGRTFLSPIPEQAKAIENNTWTHVKTCP